MIYKLCAYSGCNELAEQGHIYCKEHLEQSQEKHKQWLIEHNKRKPFQSAENPNKELYNTSRWRTLRRNHLAIEPQCAICGSTENLTVDHMNPPKGDEELFFDKYNLQTLCHACHLKKTIWEIQNKGQV